MKLSVPSTESSGAKWYAKHQAWSCETRE
jgi:hypothetical protein